jgi:hypothetical protein
MKIVKAVAVAEATVEMRAAIETIKIEAKMVAASLMEVETEATVATEMEVVLAVLDSVAASPRLQKLWKARPHLSCLTISDSPLKSLTHSLIFTSTELILALLTVAVKLVWRPSVTLTRL